MLQKQLVTARHSLTKQRAKQNVNNKLIELEEVISMFLSLDQNVCIPFPVVLQF